MGGASQPLKLDSRKPTMPIESFTMKEGRYAMLAQADPERAKQLAREAQTDADERWRLYEQVAGVHRTITEDCEDDEAGGHAPAAVAAPTPKEVQ
jgi:pyruvate-ferredoxin/flavodoxin oxidoreductase